LQAHCKEGVAMRERAASTQAPVCPGGSAHAIVAEPIDYAYLARFTLGNAALEREVLELFATQTPSYVDQLGRAPSRKAWKETAHTIKGSALAVGARRLAAVAQLTEQLEVDADLAARERALAAVTAAADEVCRHIACRFATA
jgi:HPt (histidine-containing phosphotransfer) domain-containing protein